LTSKPFGPRWGRCTPRMATRVPTSVLVLVDRRIRLNAELQRLHRLKKESADLYKQVKATLEAIDKLLEERVEAYDHAMLPSQSNYRSHTQGQYGALNNIILRALKAAGGGPLTAADILCRMDVTWPEDWTRPDDLRVWGKNVRRRLWHLRAKGVLVSPFMGGGYNGLTTWMINPERLQPVAKGTQSTHQDAASPGSNRKTTVTADTDEHA